MDANVSREPWAAVRETHSGTVVLLGDRAYKVKKPVALGLPRLHRRGDPPPGLRARGRAQPSPRARRLPRRRRARRARRHHGAGRRDAADAGGRAALRPAAPRRRRERRRGPHRPRAGRLPQQRRARPAHRRAGHPDGHHRALGRQLRPDPPLCRDRAARRAPHRGRDAGARVPGRSRGPLRRPDPARGGRGRPRRPHHRRHLLPARRAAAARLPGVRRRACATSTGSTTWPSWRWGSRTRAHRTWPRGWWRPGPSSSATPHPPALVHHFIAYRAFVRAKVGCLSGAQLDRPAPERVTAYAEMARDHLLAGAVSLVLVGGPPGVGKTTLAHDVADRLGMVVLSSDRLRKEAAGLDPRASARAAFGCRHLQPRAHPGDVRRHAPARRPAAAPRRVGRARRVVDRRSRARPRRRAGRRRAGPARPAALRARRGRRRGTDPGAARTSPTPTRTSPRSCGARRSRGRSSTPVDMRRSPAECADRACAVVRPGRPPYAAAAPPPADGARLTPRRPPASGTNVPGGRVVRPGRAPCRGRSMEAGTWRTRGTTGPPRGGHPCTRGRGT